MTRAALRPDLEIGISLNGENRLIAEGTSVMALIDGLKLDARKVAVERNAAIVPRSQYGDTLISPGDQLEIVHFIGGG